MSVAPELHPSDIFCWHGPFICGWIKQGKVWVKEKTLGPHWSMNLICNPPWESRFKISRALGSRYFAKAQEKVSRWRECLRMFAKQRLSNWPPKLSWNPAPFGMVTLLVKWPDFQPHLHDLWEPLCHGFFRGVGLGLLRSLKRQGSKNGETAWNSSVGTRFLTKDPSDFLPHVFAAKTLRWATFASEICLGIFQGWRRNLWPAIQFWAQKL